MCKELRSKTSAQHCTDISVHLHIHLHCFHHRKCVCVCAHTSESESDELEDEDDDESLELSDAMPVDSCRSTLSASAARSGRSCFRILKQQKKPPLAQPARSPHSTSYSSHSSPP